jgi:hypothetical protein
LQWPFSDVKLHRPSLDQARREDGFGRLVAQTINGRSYRDRSMASEGLLETAPPTLTISSRYLSNDAMNSVVDEEAVRALTSLFS